MSKSRYYAPYDRLLNYALIEDSFTFCLAMKTEPNDRTFVGYDGIDFHNFMVVSNQEQKPVLIVDIQNDSWVDHPYSCQMADTQMHVPGSSTMRCYLIAQFLSCMG